MPVVCVALRIAALNACVLNSSLIHPGLRHDVHAMHRMLVEYQQYCASMPPGKARGVYAVSRPT